MSNHTDEQVEEAVIYLMDGFFTSIPSHFDIIEVLEYNAGIEGDDDFYAAVHNAFVAEIDTAYQRWDDQNN